MPPATGLRRAALYARYSSDLQNPRSIDDQFDLCRAHCAREGMVAAEVFVDRALSGATTAGRQGLDALMAGAAARRFDVVVVEALDRLSRDMADLATIYKLLRFAGIALVAVHDGTADEIAIGVRGLVGALYLTDLAHKTRRGLAGKLKQGQRAGGLPYGYRAIAGRPGEHAIHDEEAEVVRRIFARYAAGAVPRAIAAELNADGVKPMRGRAWTPAALHGAQSKGAGMLSNEIYAGTIVWNRVAKIKNPTTGKKVPRANPREDWMRAEAPHLRIVDAETWAVVQARLAERRCGPRASVVTNRKRLLSGLLKCPACGSSIVSAGSKDGRPIANCSRARQSGDCSNSRRIYLDTLEQAVVDGLRERLGRPEILGEVVREYHAERRRMAADGAREQHGRQRRLAELRTTIGRLVDAIATGTGQVAAVLARLGELEAEERELVDAIAVVARATDVVAMHPKALDSYLAEIDRLWSAVQDRDMTEAFAIVRRLVDHVVVHPCEKGKPVVFEIAGRLAALLGPRGGSVGFPPWAPSFP